MELDAVACRSLKANRGDEWPLLGSDVLDVANELKPRLLGIAEGELTVLAGGPPCQPYSKAAMWASSAWAGTSDPRARPLEGFLQLVRSFRPAAVLIENVPGFAQGPRSALHVVEHAFLRINEECGTSYSARAVVVDAADYGVPQHRSRCILVAFRNGRSFEMPEPTHRSERVRAWDAIGDLEDDERCVATGRWAKLLPSIPEGENYLWHTRRGGGVPLFGYRTRHWSFLLKLAKQNPSWTLPAQPGPSTGPFHWDNRPLTIREMLRLQSFPASWCVKGSRRERVRQVGNAAPPLLCEVIGRAILDQLGYVAPTGRFELSIDRRTAVPRARARRPVPSTFMALAGAHADHPGAGSGPRPRIDRSPSDLSVGQPDGDELGRPSGISQDVQVP